MIVAGAGAGVFGSLLGLGGGILIVPLLTLGFGLPLREAVAVSLVSVIVTSSASAGVYLQRHVANLRLGMTLEMFTAFGALVGGLLAFSISDRALAALFAILLIYVAITMLRRKDAPKVVNPPTADLVPTAASSEAVAFMPAMTDDGLDPGEAGGPADSGGAAVVLAAPAATPAEAATQASTRPAVPAAPATATKRRSWVSEAEVERLSGPGYRVHGFRIGVVGALFAGVVSALLGVGGGIVKVPVMNLAMGVPLRIATATSNLMIGVTASASAIVYLLRGGIDPYVAGPTAVGVFIGASIGSRVAHRVDLRILRWLFIIVVFYNAIQMALKALG